MDEQLNPTPSASPTPSVERTMEKPINEPKAPAGVGGILGGVMKSSGQSLFQGVFGRSAANPQMPGGGNQNGGGLVDRFISPEAAAGAQADRLAGTRPFGASLQSPDSATIAIRSGASSDATFADMERRDNTLKGALVEALTRRLNGGVGGANAGVASGVDGGGPDPANPAAPEMPAIRTGANGRNYADVDGYEIDLGDIGRNDAPAIGNAVADTRSAIADFDGFYGKAVGGDEAVSEDDDFAN